MATNKVIILAISCIVLVAALPTSNSQQQPQPQPQPQPQGVNTNDLVASAKGLFAQSYQTVLQYTNSTDSKDLLKKGLVALIGDVNVTMDKTDNLKNLTRDKMIAQAIDICGEVLQSSVDSLQKSVDRISSQFDPNRIDEYVEDLKIWVGGVFSDQMVCKDGFQGMPGRFGKKMRQYLEKSRKLALKTLDTIGEFAELMLAEEAKGTPKRRLLEEDETNPDPISRRLLAVNIANVQPNVVVAQDGSGKYKTLNEALKDIPPGNAQQFVIHLKAGVYAEQVSFTKEMSNVVLIGDGPTVSRITGKLNYAQGVQTFKTSTVAIMGDDFIAKDVGFENSAGPEGHQAVALRVQADKAVFLNCHMDGYQDTLYAQKFRQFYRDCTITGTVDFIFGDAAAVFQNCNMVVRKPGANQNCMVTAQGKDAEPELTGYVLQNCIISAEPALTATPPGEHQVFLGRPWKAFAKTVVIQSQIDGIVDPAGWAEWKGENFQETCYYAEFGNRGPGSVLDKRVAWNGYKRITPEIAQSYVPAQFYLGDTWLPQTGVPYFPGWMAV